MKPTQIFATAVVLGLMASPAIAQDDMIKDKAKDEAVTIMADEVEEAKDGTMTMTGDPLTIETPENKTDLKNGVLMVKPNGETIMKGDEVTITPDIRDRMMKDNSGTSSEAPTTVTGRPRTKPWRLCVR